MMKTVLTETKEAKEKLAAPRPQRSKMFALLGQAGRGRR